MEDTRQLKFTVVVRQTNGQTLSQEVENNTLVGQLKLLLSERTEIPVDRMRLMHGSDILNDDHSLELCGITESGTALRLVQLAGATQNHPHNVNGIASANAPPAMSSAAARGLNQSRQLILSNPQLVQTLMMANPQMREAIENNPELQHMMRDPQIMRQGLEAAQNPRLMEEMKRNNDRMLSNLETSPGGYAHIRRMYHNVQEPLARAAEDSTRMPLDELNRRRARLLGVTKPDASKVNTTPLPNPWARSRPRANSRPAAGELRGNTGDPGNPFMLADQLSRNAERLARLDISTSQAAGSSRTGSQPYARDPFAISRNQDHLGDLTARLRAAAQQEQLQQQQQDQQQIRDLMASRRVAQTSAMSVDSPAPSLPLPLPLSSALTLTEADRSRFRHELEQLEEMGFDDVEKNLRALIETDGDLASALSIIADEDD
ncbi:hypothetical protein BX661DRAFT_185935 [Kickxella alabastrina]|uniref:uncharacterized protein n=1 Tax=Kickxella alabastrina TaxID=61397 RepID=UPI002220ADDE|nr:uncharacterized protein BX661DRAFT_185935 [Kickxella alabastrina]KAI7823919.1 hypothetical protein BX661DRAFT_185935 [Kickxella alabastrina]